MQKGRPMSSLKHFELNTWIAPISAAVQEQAVNALEGGSVLYFPSLPFFLNDEEKIFLSPEILDPKSKNISYDERKDRLGGAIFSDEKSGRLKEMLKRYAQQSRQLLENLIPHYVPNLIQAKTSFRPVEIFGRKTSYRKDDTLLHVDSFPSSPTKGQRILRVFTNINHEGKSRVWRVGEPFSDVVQKIAPKVSHPIFGVAHLLKALKITKECRTPYDHYMLHIHNVMKGDPHYQKTVPQEDLQFPPGSSWIVYTDQVSHAAMSGQHVLEQTFHMPVDGLNDPSTSPLKVLERYFNKSLV
jgi:hypothetical protein